MPCEKHLFLGLSIWAVYSKVLLLFCFALSVHGALISLSCGPLHVTPFKLLWKTAYLCGLPLSFLSFTLRSLYFTWDYPKQNFRSWQKSRVFCVLVINTKQHHFNYVDYIYMDFIALKQRLSPELQETMGSKSQNVGIILKSTRRSWFVTKTELNLESKGANLNDHGFAYNPARF